MDKLNSTPPYAVDAQNEYQTQLSQRKIIEAIEHELSLEDETNHKECFIVFGFYLNVECLCMLIALYGTK
jgi:hypothetical protein